MAWHKRSNFLLLAGGASVYPLDSYVLVKIPFGHRLCLGMYYIPLWTRKYKCHGEFQKLCFTGRGFKMHEGTRVDVRRCESVTKHVYMYYGAFVLWCSSSSVDIKKVLYRVLIREANKCILLYSSVVILSLGFFTIPVSVTKSHTYAPSKS